MDINRDDDQAIVISGLDTFFLELLRQIPASADPDGNRHVERRLFSNPAEPVDDPGLCEDWKEYIQPGLKHLFESSNQTVRDDLQKVEEVKAGDDLMSHTLRIPGNHFDAWLNSLNQARLALVARHRFTEKDMEARVRNELASVRELSLLQIHFYGYLQELILSEI